MTIESVIKKLRIIGAETYKINSWAVIYWTENKSSRRSPELPEVPYPDKFGILNTVNGDMLEEKYMGIRIATEQFIVFTSEYNADPEIDNIDIVWTRTKEVRVRGGAIFTQIGPSDKMLFGYVNYIESFQEDNDKYIVIRDDGEYIYLSLIEHIGEEYKRLEYWQAYISVIHASAIRDDEESLIIVNKYINKCLEHSIATIDYGLTVRWANGK